MRRFILFATLLVLTSACTADPEAPVTDRSTSASAPSTRALETESSLPPSRPEVATTSSTSTSRTSATGSTARPSVQSSPIGTTPLPAPGTSAEDSTAFSPEEQALADAAWARFEEYRQIIEAAEADPSGQDWVSMLEDYATGHKFIEQAELILSLADAQYRATGHFKFTRAATISVTPSDVYFDVCVDPRQAVLVNAQGEVVGSDTGTPRLFQLRMNRPGISDWMVVEILDKSPVQPC